MNTQANLFKQAIREGRPQIGLWSSLCSNIAAEVVASAGFDWILIDTEHAPNELPIGVQPVASFGGSTAAPVVRPAWNDMVVVKRLLDVARKNLPHSLMCKPLRKPVRLWRDAVSATRHPWRGPSPTARISLAG